MALQAPPFQAMKSLKLDVSCAIFALVFLPLTTHAEPLTTMDDVGAAIMSCS